MRQLLALFAVTFLFCSCKKDQENARPSKLSGIQFDPSPNNPGANHIFNLDASGKITSIVTSYTDGRQETRATIRYNGNTIIISFPSIHDDAVDYDNEIKYLVDAEGKPLQRIQQIKDALKANPPIQYDISNDTSFYEYGSDGLPGKITGQILDSTWMLPFTYSIAVKKIYGTTFVNSNGNVQSSEKKTTRTEVQRNGGGGQLVSSLTTTIESRQFEYNKAYPNKTDFSNALVLSELYPGLPTFSFMQPYKNLPDRVSGSFIEKDENGNVIYSGDQGAYSFLVSYNWSFLIHSVKAEGNNFQARYIYTR